MFLIMKVPVKGCGSVVSEQISMAQRDELYQAFANTGNTCK